MEVPKTLNKKLVTAVVASLILLGIAWRLVPHVPNFAPISAIALVLCMTIGWRKSLLAVLAIMAVSDLVIGGYSGMYWTWLGFGLIVALGYGIRRLPMVWRILAGALGASTLFFIVSNFGTWISSGMYSLNLAGLIQCYTMAIPFFKATLASDLIFTGLLLTSYEIYATYVRLPKTERAATHIYSKNLGLVRTGTN